MKPFKIIMAGIMLMILPPDVPAETSPADTQYMIIVADMDRPAFPGTGRIYISVDGQQYIEEKVPASEVKDKYDYSYLIRLIKKFNREGWQLLNGDLTVVAKKNRQQGRIFILMTRKNPYTIDRTPIDTIYHEAPVKDSVLQKR